MADLNKPWDTSEGYEQYVKRLQTVQQTLKDTDEPVTDATMKRVAQGQFECHPHMVDHVHEYIEWEEEDSDNKQQSWSYFRAYFEKRNRRHVNSQRTLAEAGIANSAQLHKDLDDMKAMMAKQQQLMALKSEQLEEALTEIAKVTVNNQEQLANSASAFAAAAAASSRQPPAAPAPPATTPQDFGSILKMILANQTNTSTNRRSPTGPTGPGKKRNCSKYCWSHGACAHISPDCSNPREGHQLDATFALKKNGST